MLDKYKKKSGTLENSFQIMTIEFCVKVSNFSGVPGPFCQKTQKIYVRIRIFSTAIHFNRCTKSRKNSVECKCVSKHNNNLINYGIILCLTFVKKYSSYSIVFIIKLYIENEFDSVEI